MTYLEFCGRKVGCRSIVNETSIKKMKDHSNFFNWTSSGGYAFVQEVGLTNCVEPTFVVLCV